MLSSSAFNALLKTLEEPPEHVKFIFATTEIRKVPVTVLSRCQRFDLRRIEADKLATHLGTIAAAEGARLAPNALALVARAADGSARDGLSLLDQAITLGEPGEEVSEEQVRAMLGIADRTQLFELYEAVMAGKAAEALGQLRRMYEAGADPIVVLQDLLDLTHWLTRCKLTPDVLNHPAVPEAERKRGGALAKDLSLPVLARSWQMLLKGLGEAQYAPQPLAAVEMALIRLMHVADLPTPGDLVKQLVGPGGASAPAPASSPRGGGSGNGPTNYGGPVTNVISNQAVARDPNAQQAPVQASMPRIETFDALVELFKEKKEGILLTHLTNNVHLVHFEHGRIELRPTPMAPSDLPNRVAACLLKWTGARWLVGVSGDLGAPTLKEQAQAAEAELRRRAAEHPLVKAVLDAFPGATIDAVRDLKVTEESHAAEDEAAPLPEEDQ
jgi:DNA polymerase-3 subunit gamma/tau